jgi:hypothetical protein
MEINKQVKLNVIMNFSEAATMAVVPSFLRLTDYKSIAFIVVKPPKEPRQGQTL